MSKAIKENNYFLFIPLLITVLLYLPSLSYGFRNFDENILIQDFYTNKTFGEYIEKFFLIHLGGVSEAHGFSFSGIKNIHVSILGIPAFYLISFLFKAKPLLFHLWILFLHLLVLYFFCKFCFELTQNKNISVFSGLIWTLHPGNVEPVIWACNWAQPLGAVFYFYTLYKIASCRGLINQTPTAIFILFITIIQILFTEHTLTISIAIFLIVLYQSKNFTSAFKTSLPSFIVIFAYVVFRMFLVGQAQGLPLQVPLQERLIFLSPQIFFHQLKLVIFPDILTIDQLDHLNLNNQTLSIVIFILFLLLIFAFKQKATYLSFGLLMYLITMLPFLQIVPLYSMVAERYNYFGSAFFALGVMSVLFQKVNMKLFSYILPVILCICLGIKSYIRICEWKNSETLFLSTINTSKSLFKKGIWTYNLAVETPRRGVSTQKDESKRDELLKLSINLLDLFIQNNPDTLKPKILTKYELDDRSLLSKAALRIATSYGILNQKEKQLKYLLKALDFSYPDLKTQGLIFQNLGTFYFQKNDFKKAIKSYEKSKSISPNPGIDYLISLCYLKLNDLSNYEKYLKNAASVISANNTKPFKTYGQLLELIKNDYGGAVKYYKIATLLEDSPEPYVLLATLYLKQNKIEDAFKFVKRGLHSFSKNPNLLYLHGAILLNKGEKEAGIKDLAKVAENPNAPNDIRIEACNILLSTYHSTDPMLTKKCSEVILSTDRKFPH